MKKTELIWGSEPRSPAWRARVLSRGAVVGRTNKTSKTLVLPCFYRIEHGLSVALIWGSYLPATMAAVAPLLLI